MLHLATVGRQDFEVDEPWIEMLNDIVASGDTSIKGANSSNRADFEHVLTGRQALLRELGWLSPESPVYEAIQKRPEKFRSFQRSSYIIENLRTLYENASDEMMLPIYRDISFAFSHPRAMQERTAITHDLGHDNKLLFKLSPYLFLKASHDSVAIRAKRILDLYTARQQRAQQAESKHPRYERAKEAASTTLNLEFDTHKDMLTVVAAARLEDPDFAITPEWVDELNTLITSGSRRLPQGYTPTTPPIMVEENRALAKEIRTDRYRLFEELGWLDQSPAHAIKEAEKYFNPEGKDLARSDFTMQLLMVFYEYLGQDMMTILREQPRFVIKLRAEAVREQLQAVDGISGRTAAEFLRHRAGYLLKYSPEALQQKAPQLWDRLEPTKRRQQPQRSLARSALQKTVLRSEVPPPTVFSLERDNGWLRVAFATESDAEIAQRIDRLNDILRRSYEPTSKDTNLVLEFYHELGLANPQAAMSAELKGMEDARVNFMMKNVRTFYAYTGERFMSVIFKEPRLLRKAPLKLQRAFQATAEAGYDVYDVLSQNPGFFMNAPVNRLKAGVNPLAPPEPARRTVRAVKDRRPRISRSAPPSQPAEPIEIPVNPYIKLQESFDQAPSTRQRALNKLARRYLFDAYNSGLEVVEVFPELLAYSPGEFYKVMSSAIRYYNQSDDPSTREMVRLIRASIIQLQTKKG